MIKSYFIEHKKICIIAICIIAILAILSILMLSFKIINSDDKVEFITINSRDNLYSLTLSTKLDYVVNNSSDTLSLDISDNSKAVYIYGNTLEKSRNIALYDVISEDKNSYFSSKANVSELSNIQEIALDNCSGYEYSVSYLDNSYGKEFYCNVVWLQTDSHIFILNFEVAKDNLENIKPILDAIKASFKLVS